MPKVFDSSRRHWDEYNSGDTLDYVLMPSV